MSNPNTIYLKDYKAPSFQTETIDLYINIFDDHTKVDSVMTIKRIDEGATELVLNGVDLELKKLVLNDKELTPSDYILQAETLTVKNVTEKINKLQVEVVIHPESNLSCEGLYKSGKIFCTQNEPEGFRKITFFQDHPDVLAIYRTTVEADKNKFPYLLSNGNKEKAEDLPGGRHRITWFDPHPKPSYLYAVVAGDLARVTDKFTTMSGREVALEIYVDHGNEDKCEHAMTSLINSMKWDEEKFGREYDLDIYMIVAVDSFNMGAMENKGLNIFNSAYVLASTETATDQNFQGIESVIGHEYFHNWTGNRVTCRDWFQLTLKEGLTVFRDQEFSSDMLSRPVKRIDDVKALRTAQFPEDGGPMAHPIKPKSYIEVNNFYTATVYEKGAEVIRMMHTILGEKNFRKGMDLYFERNDGKAVTTEDFVSALSDASGVDLEQFKLWYDQVGTPKVKVQEKYDEKAQIYMLTLTQEAKLEDKADAPLFIPLRLGLIGRDGGEIKTEADGMIFLKEKTKTFEFKNISSQPVLSINRGFTAPVIIEKEDRLDDLIFLLKHDTDSFNRYDTAQRLYLIQIKNILAGRAVDENFMDAYGTLLEDALIDPSFAAYILDVTSLAEINDSQEKPSYAENQKARNHLRRELALKYEGELLEIYTKLIPKGEFDLRSESMGKRALRNFCLSELSTINSEMTQEILWDHYCEASNMTDELAGLGAIVKSNHPNKEKALENFYKKWKHETLVIQKWFALQATSVSEEVFEAMPRLMALPEYDKTVPNIVRSVVGQFAMNNPVRLNEASGRGFDFVAKAIVEIDGYNPQLASRLAKALGHKKKLDVGVKQKLEEKLNWILTHKLSNDTFEVVSRNLNG